MSDDRVAAFATNTAAYFAHRSEKDPSKPETYVFMQGQFFGGTVRDRGLEKMPFITVARALAPGLREQNFVPAPTFADADLLLVVHWGVTIGRNRDYELEYENADRGRALVADYPLVKARETADQAAGGPISGPSVLSVNQAVDFALLEQSTEKIASAASGKTAANLLGFSLDMSREEAYTHITEKSRTLTTLLEADRYFVIVIAYDCQRLIHGKHLVPLWTARLSIPSAGVNFPTALTRMNAVGGQVYGTNQQELTITRSKKKKENVSIGDAIVIEYLRPETPPPTTPSGQ